MSTSCTEGNRPWPNICVNSVTEESNAAAPMPIVHARSLKYRQAKYPNGTYNNTFPMMSAERTGGETKGTQRMRIQWAWFWTDHHGTTTATMTTINPVKQNAWGLREREEKGTANTIRKPNLNLRLPDNGVLRRARMLR